MAAPIYSRGPNSIAPFAGTVPTDYTLSGVTATISGETLQLEGNGYAELAFSPALDMSDRYFYLAVRWTISSNLQFSVQFYDSSGNQKNYNGPASGRRKDLTYISDLYHTADFESGTLDLTDITAIRFDLDQGGTHGQDFRLIILDEILIEEGDALDPANTAGIQAFIESDMPAPITTGVSEQHINSIGRTLLQPHRLRFGNTAFYDNNSQGGILIPTQKTTGDNASGWDAGAANDSSNNDISVYTADQRFRQIIFDSNNAYTISGQQLSEISLINESSAVLTWQGWTLAEMIEVSYGSNLANNHSIFGVAQPVTVNSDGAINGLTIEDSTASHTFDWAEGSASVRNLTINNSTNAAVRLTGLGSYQLDSFSFSGNTYDFEVTQTSGTVEIQVDVNSSTDHPGGFNDSGYVAAKVLSAGATVVIAAPVQTFLRGVSGAPSGSTIGLFRRSRPLIADTSEFTLAAGNSVGNSTLVVNEAIPDDKSSTGFIRAYRDDGITEDRLAYSSFSGSTFTLDSVTLPVTYSSGNGAYVGYLDIRGSSSGDESESLQFVSDRDCVLCVRLGSGSSAVEEIRQNVTLTNQDQVFPVSGVPDSNNNR